jgi:hypothetical protein
MNKKLNCASKIILIVQGCFISTLFFPGTAFAYVDPGSGSVIITTVLGLIAAVGYTFRKYFYKIKKMLTRKKLEEDKQKDGE